MQVSFPIYIQCFTHCTTYWRRTTSGIRQKTVTKPLRPLKSSSHQMQYLRIPIMIQTYLCVLRPTPLLIGAVLSHIMPNCEERPIAYASRSLSTSEKNYSQIEKEALGIIWGVKRFNTYVYGRQFRLITDHEPLISIFGPKRGIANITTARLQR